MVIAQLSQRPLRGSRLSSFYPPIPAEGPSLSDLDSAFQLQEYISLLIRKNPHDVEAIVSLPGKAKGKGDVEDSSAEKDGKNEVVVDEACWIYEHLRRIAQDLSHPLITSLQQECSRASCPEMKAGEWLYLCVAHGNDGAMEQCCAIDYIIHTLDSATALLNSPRAFPSRLSIPQASIRHFSSLARRLGRIFAHAYFHHREAFESAEAESSLYARFLALTARFELVPSDFLVIPPRLLNNDSSQGTDISRDADPPRLLGASIHPSGGGREQRGGMKEEREDQSYMQQKFGMTGPESSDRNLPPPERRSISPAEPGVQSSPRKFGRNRTDTMIFSDVAAFNEELQRNAASHEHEHEADTDAVDTREEEDVHEQIQSGPPPAGLPREETEERTQPPPGHEDAADVPQSEVEGTAESDSDKPSELPHVNTLELIAESKEFCKPHVDPSVPSPAIELSSECSHPAPQPTAEVPTVLETLNNEPPRDADETDIELLLERKRILDEAEAQSHTQGQGQDEKEKDEEEGEEENKGEGFIVIGEQENDEASSSPASSLTGDVAEAPEEKGDAETETEHENAVPTVTDISEPQGPMDNKEEEIEVDPNTTIEEDLHDVEKALQS